VSAGGVSPAVLAGYGLTDKGRQYVEEIMRMYAAGARVEDLDVLMGLIPGATKMLMAFDALGPADV